MASLGHYELKQTQLLRKNSVVENPNLGTQTYYANTMSLVGVYICAYFFKIIMGFNNKKLRVHGLNSY